MMKDLTFERFAGLVRTGSVSRVFMLPYPAIDGGGWYLDVDHKDDELRRQVYTQRGAVRVFKTADAAIDLVRRQAHYTGDLRVCAEVQA